MNEQDRKDRFARAMVDAQPSIFAYVMSLTARSGDAHEILQQTNLVLWQKWAEYDESRGDSFTAWACGIARFEVLARYRDKSRDRHVFSEQAMLKLADMPGVEADEVSARMRALQVCLDKLQPQQRKMILMRYTSDGSVPEIAKAVGRPARSVSVTLSRIRKTLFDCVRSETAAEDDA